MINIRRHGWILVIAVVYFAALSATLTYKRIYLLNDWPFDQAHMIQQFHNWRSGYPKVTIQPGDLRSGPTGEQPFHDNHTHRIYAVFRVFYRIWPYPETLILMYALLVSLSVVTLHLFLGRLSLRPLTMFGLELCWMLYPLQQKVAVYTFASPLAMSGTFYFFYLYLLSRDSPFAILGCLGLLLPREETIFMILPTFLLLPRKWKTLLWHSACMIPFFVFAKHGTGNPFAYAAAAFHPLFIANFLLTQTVLWALALVNPLALLIAAGFMLAIIGVGGEVYFWFPYDYVGGAFTSRGDFYYYGLITPLLMAAVALGVARLKPHQTRRLYVSLALLLVPGVAYGLCQLRYLARSRSEAQEIQAFKRAMVPKTAAVVTDYALSATFANRDQIYVYLQPPKGVTPEQVFSRADVAVIPKVHTVKIEALFLRPSPQTWVLVGTSPNYVFYRKQTWSGAATARPVH
ncbi:MAG TPA: hypothetical protein VL486_03760 [Verrucomicrobiae bacterium]|nr:hypothetical protein [Verrucomicrobiae bacterium]